MPRGPKNLSSTPIADRPTNRTNKRLQRRDYLVRSRMVLTSNGKTGKVDLALNADVKRWHDGVQNVVLNLVVVILVVRP